MKLIKAGINFVCNLWNAVTAVVTVIVNAFNAFMAWAIEFIQSTLNALFGPLIDKVQSMSDRA